MTITIRWFFAIVAITAGIVVLVDTKGDRVGVATGLGLIAAGIEGIVP